MGVAVGMAVCGKSVWQSRPTEKVRVLHLNDWAWPSLLSLYRGWAELMVL